MEPLEALHEFVAKAREAVDEGKTEVPKECSVEELPEWIDRVVAWLCVEPTIMIAAPDLWEELIRRFTPEGWLALEPVERFATASFVGKWMTTLQ